jgi:hypothetical protein
MPGETISQYRIAEKRAEVSRGEIYPATANTQKVPDSEGLGSGVWFPDGLYLAADRLFAAPGRETVPFNLEACEAVGFTWIPGRRGR